jgi:hypothetical protein
VCVLSEFDCGVKAQKFVDESKYGYRIDPENHIFVRKSFFLSTACNNQHADMFNRLLPVLLFDALGMHIEFKYSSCCVMSAVQRENVE